MILVKIIVAIVMLLMSLAAAFPFAMTGHLVTSAVFPLLFISTLSLRIYNGPGHDIFYVLAFTSSLVIVAAFFAFLSKYQLLGIQSVFGGVKVPLLTSGFLVVLLLATYVGFVLWWISGPNNSGINLPNG